MYSMCDYRQGKDWWIGFIDYLYTPLRTTSNYNAIANLHTSQITTAPAKSFSIPVCCAFNSSSLAVASNSEDSSASHPHIITVQWISHNWTLVNCRLNYSTIPLSLPCRAQLNCQPSTNWVPGWQPFHTNLLFFPSQADFQLTNDNWTLSLTNQLLHFTQFNWTELQCLGSSLYSLGADPAENTTSNNPSYKMGFGVDDWIYCTLYIHTVWDYKHYSAIAILHTFKFTITHALGFSVFTSRILAMDLSHSLTVTSTNT
jgi:hypothetical protein